MSVNAIGRELGVSGRALHRYFRNRDALPTELIVDAYRDLAAALSGAHSERIMAASEEAMAALTGVIAAGGGVGGSAHARETEPPARRAAQRVKPPPRSGRPGSRGRAP